MRASATSTQSERGPPREPGSAPERLTLGHLGGHLGYFVRRLQVAVFQDFIRVLAPMDVRPAQYSVLLIVDANPGRSQADIGRTLGIERARLARLLHELERRRWIERRTATADARSHALFLSRAGKRALARIKELAAQHEARLTQFLAPERRAVLMALLKDLGPDALAAVHPTTTLPGPADRSQLSSRRDGRAERRLRRASQDPDSEKFP